MDEGTAQSDQDRLGKWSFKLPKGGQARVGPLIPAFKEPLPLNRPLKEPLPLKMLFKDADLEHRLT